MAKDGDDFALVDFRMMRAAKEVEQHADALACGEKAEDFGGHAVEKWAAKRDSVAKGYRLGENEAFSGPPSVAKASDLYRVDCSMQPAKADDRTDSDGIADAAVLRVEVEPGEQVIRKERFGTGQDTGPCGCTAAKLRVKGFDTKGSEMGCGDILPPRLAADAVPGTFVITVDHHRGSVAGRSEALQCGSCSGQVLPWEPGKQNGS